MTQNDDDKKGAPDTDILSAIRRIVDEEQSAATVPAAPAPIAAARGALVLTPTMRTNAAEDESDEVPPLRLTKRVDAPTSQEASRAQSLRNAFEPDPVAAPPPVPLRLQPAARVDAAPEAPAVAEPAPTPAPLSGFAGYSAPVRVETPPAARDDAPAPVPAPTPEAAAPPAAPPAVAPMAQAPAPETRASAAPETDLAGLDRAALDALITEKLRQDLSGELGARISANIRTLVQREVQTAVAAAMAKRQP